MYTISWGCDSSTRYLTRRASWQLEPGLIWVKTNMNQWMSFFLCSYKTGSIFSQQIEEHPPSLLWGSFTVWRHCVSYHMDVIWTLYGRYTPRWYDVPVNTSVSENKQWHQRWSAWTRQLVGGEMWCSLVDRAESSHGFVFMAKSRDQDI